MTASWTPTLISELCDITSSKRIYAADYQSEGIPFYRGKEISEKQSGKSSVSSELFISIEKYKEIKKRFGVPQGGDLLLTSVGTLGVPYVVRPNETFYFKDGNLTWFRNLKGVDSHFLYYWLLSPDGKAELKKCTIGSSQPAFTIVLLKGMKVNLPPESIQRKIAGVLSAYDGLIENNTRRIQVLEEMARRLYEEWFVRFRFPGYENVKMVESELGLIPECWRVQGLYDISEITYGFPFKSKLFNTNGEGISIVRIRDIRNDKTSTYTDEPFDEKHVLSDGDILIGMDGEFHMGRWAGGKAVLNQRVVMLPPKNDLPKYFLFLVTEKPIKHLEATIVGTTVAHLSAQDLKSMKLIIPSDDILGQARPLLDSLFEQEVSLKKKNDVLHRTRDLILPKLISGEIDVSNFPEPAND